MKFTLPGIPLAKARQRVRFRRIGKQLAPWQYDPQQKSKEAVAAQLKLQVEGEKSDFFRKGLNLARDQSFLITLVFYLPIPQSCTQAQKNAKLWGFEIPPRQDIDNLTKFILDVCNGILFYDDKLVESIYSQKFYSENPRTEITLSMKEKVYLPKSAKEIVLQFSPSELEIFRDDCEKMAKILSKTPKYLLPNDTVEGLLAASCFLSEFSRKYSKKISKIEKLSNKEAEYADIT